VLRCYLRKPAELAATLNAVAPRSTGPRRPTRTTLVQLRCYLTKLNPELARANDDIPSSSSPSAMSTRRRPRHRCEPSPTSRRPAAPSPEEQANLSSLYGSATATRADLTTYLRQNKDNLIRLSADSRGTLGPAREVAPVLPLHAAHAGRLRARLWTRRSARARTSRACMSTSPASRRAAVRTGQGHPGVRRERRPRSATRSRHAARYDPRRPPRPPGGSLNAATLRGTGRTPGFSAGSPPQLARPTPRRRTS